MRKNHPVTEVDLPVSTETNILSTTNLKGQITYINQDFIDISGFEIDELIDQPHNIIRHPFMPPLAFDCLWKNLKSGQSWMGIVKNRSKNGDHYWVDAYATPIMDANDKPMEFQSVRVKASQKHIDRAETIYAQLNDGKSNSKLSDSKVSTLNIWMIASVVPLALMYLLLSFFSDLSISSIWVLLVAIVVNVVLMSYLYAPLKRIIEKVYHQYQDPVARYVYTGRNDDLGQILLALKQSDTESGAIVGRMSDDSHQMMKELEKMNSNVQKNVVSLQELFTDNEQVAAAVEEMSASIQEVSSNIQTTSKLSDEANATAKNSQKVIENTVKSIGRLAGEIESSAEVVKKLEEDSNDINNVVDVIKSVAEQTNLLALNAAIEAARAGDQGRGFAVVADEVRTLATRTHESTEEIMAMVEKLRNAALNAVNSMSKATDIAGSTVEMTGETTHSIDSIVESMANISNMSTQIATAAEQQSIVSNEISQNVSKVKLKSEQILQNSQDSERTSNRVFTTSSNLYELAQQFWRKKRAS